MVCGIVKKTPFGAGGGGVVINYSNSESFLLNRRCECVVSVRGVFVCRCINLDLRVDR